MRMNRRKGKSPLPPFKEFQERFRTAFGREMTREERRFYRLVNIVLTEQDHTNSSALASTQDNPGPILDNAPNFAPKRKLNP